MATPIHGSCALDGLSEAYELHQRRTRGLRACGVLQHQRLVRRFVRSALGEDPIDPSRFDPSDVIEVVDSMRSRFSPRSLKAVRTALRSFFHFLRAEGLCDGRLEVAIPAVAHRRLSALPRSLSDDQLEQVLTSLNVSSTIGRARVSEIINLRKADVLLDRESALHLRGKGRKERIVTLWKTTAAQLRAWLAHNNRDPDGPVFPNRAGQHLSRAGVEHRLRVAIRIASQRCPSLNGRRISPHTLRHTTAMHLLQPGVDLTVIALWLGHEDVATTHRYPRSCARPRSRRSRHGTRIGSVGWTSRVGARSRPPFDAIPASTSESRCFIARGDRCSRRSATRARACPSTWGSGSRAATARCEAGLAVVRVLHDLRLHQRLGVAYVRRALHLPFDEHGVQRAAAIVRDPDLVDHDDAGLDDDVDFRDVRGEAVRGRCADRAAAVPPCTSFGVGQGMGWGGEGAIALWRRPAHGPSLGRCRQRPESSRPGRQPEATNPKRRTRHGPPASAVYRRKQPITTPLYPIVQHHPETFLARAAGADPHGDGVPRWVERDFRAYLRCGILAHGFARIRCDACAAERLVAFSCKGRGVCPSWS